MTITHAAAYAGRRTLEVWWTGILICGFWFALVSLEPGLESRWFPVITNFRIEAVAAAPDSMVRFRPAFTKTRECDYRGLTFYVTDAQGAFVRQQVRISVLPGSAIYTSPESRPLGDHIGSWWEIALADTKGEMYGVLHHACGLPWESRSVVGPFRVEIPSDSTGDVTIVPER